MFTTNIEICQILHLFYYEKQSIETIIEFFNSKYNITDINYILYSDDGTYDDMFTDIFEC